MFIDDTGKVEVCKAKLSVNEYIEPQEEEKRNNEKQNKKEHVPQNL